MAWVALVVASGGCSGAPPPRPLYPASGDQFFLLAPPTASPDTLSCSGSADERFDCFMQDLAPRLDAVGATGSVAILDVDGRVHSGVHAAVAAAAPSAERRFAVGSLTKMVTATAVMTLVEAGMLDLDRPVADYLPELAGNAADVGDATLDQLLSHTSGIAPETITAGVDCSAEGDDLAAHVARLAGRPLLSPPGAVYNYSNLGYVVVGAVLERVAGQPFEELVASRVLIPAGMMTAGFTADPTRDVPGFVAPGTKPAALCRAMHPAGGLWASAPEMLLLLRALMDGGGSVLQSASAAMLFAPRVPTGTGPDDAYGYGVGTTVYAGVRWATHEGSLPQYAGAWAAVPDRRVAAVVLVNTGRSPAPAAVRAARILLELEPPAPPAPRPMPEWGRFVGHYRDADGALGGLTISLARNGLVLRFDDHDPPAGLPPTLTFFPADGGQANFVVSPLGVAARAASP